VGAPPPRPRHNALEAQLAGQVANDGGEAVVILHHQQQAARPGQMIAVVLYACRHMRQAALGSCVRWGRSFQGSGGRFARGDLRRVIGARQRKGKDAAFAQSAFQPDPPAKQTRQFARDRQAQACAAVSAADRSVSLLKGIENALLLLGRYADAGIRHGEGDPVAGLSRYAQLYLAAFRKLEGVRQQVLEDLLQPLTVCLHQVGSGVQLDVESQAAIVRHRLEELAHVFGQPLHRNRFGTRLDVTGFNLG